MATLDGVERTFSSDMALVCDAEGPSGIAGIMGGEISEVSDSTTRVLMEAATWVGPNIMRTSKALGLRTEASARFEKQLHPEQAIAAQRLAARLMVELCGARMVPGTIDAYPRPPEPRVVALRAERMEKLLGERIEDETASGILKRLGFSPTDDGWRVPPWRDADVQREADLIEEVARIHGLDKLPTTLPAREQAVGRLTGSQPLRRRLEDLLRDRGLLEAISYSFTSPEALGRLRLTDIEPLRVENPLSEDLSVMRPLILPGLLDAAQHNAAHGRAGVALFESAHVYLPKGTLAPLGERGQTPSQEATHISALVTQAAPAGWRTPARAADFYAVKALLEALMEAAGVEWRAQEGGPPFLHPGRAATIVAADGSELGWLGELHPLVLREWELDGPAAAFELDAERLFELAPRASTYSDVTSFPAVLQDIAVIVPDDVSAERLAEVVTEGAGELLLRCACSTSTTASRWGRATNRWPSASSSARRTARSPTRRSRSAAPRSSARSSRSGDGCVPEGVAVVGAAGYGGAVAAAILRRHPSLQLTAVTARSEAGRRHDQLYPRYRVAMTLEEFDADAVAERAQAAVVAYPHGASAPAVKALRERGLKVVDLSADFRLDRERYERWYAQHEAPELLDEAVYGLTEAHREEIRGADLWPRPAATRRPPSWRCGHCASTSTTWWWMPSRASPGPGARPRRRPTSCR